MTTKKNIYQRLNDVMKVITYIQKDKKAGMNYSIVSHDVVTAKVRVHFVEHGIVYYPINLNVMQEGNRTQATFEVRFVNIDDATDFIDVATMGYGIDTQDKGPGKALSYGVKYALLKVLGLETGDDPDQDQNVVYENEDDPHLKAINKFIADLDVVKDIDAMNKLVADATPALKLASGKFPAQAAGARSKIQQTKAKLEGSKA